MMTGDEDNAEWETAAAKSWLREIIEILGRAPSHDPRQVTMILAANAVLDLLDRPGPFLSPIHINALMSVLGRPES